MVIEKVLTGATPMINDGDLMDKEKYDLSSVRTGYFTEDFVRGMDKRNVGRMRCLPPQVQAHVIATYSMGERDPGEIHDVQKHFSGVIGGVRRLVFAGMTLEESRRLIALAVRGQRVSYKLCDHVRQGRQCPYGEECKHPHIHEQGEGSGSSWW